RQVPGYEHVPVIAVTAYALSGDRQHFLEAGFNGYLSKPFNRVVLKQAIEQVLSTGGTTAPPTA
ncbi:MAG: response regulator, partial [Bacteroidetes bacterium]